MVGLTSQRFYLLKTDTPITVCDIVQKLFGILANERLFVIASNIVPCYTIVVNVVEDSQTGFIGTVNVEFSIVRLTNLLVTSLRPWVISPAVRKEIRRLYLFPVCRPKPSEDGLGFQITTVFAALEVTETTRCPDIRYIICKQK